MLQATFEYLFVVVETIGYALRLDPRAFTIAIYHPHGARIIAGIVFLAGMSMLLGQSVMLFVNRVRRGRFFFSLLTNGVVFVISYAVWGLAVAFIATFLFEINIVNEVLIVFLIGISTAPLVFGFLILIPYMGPAIGKVLNVWQLLIMTTAVRFTFDVGIVMAIIAVGLSWLLMLLVSNTIGRPVVHLRNLIYRKITGSTLDATTQDILLEYSAGQPLPDQTPAEGIA